jgi:hypothetical protein
VPPCFGQWRISPGESSRLGSDLEELKLSFALSLSKGFPSFTQEEQGFDRVGPNGWRHAAESMNTEQAGSESAVFLDAESSSA